MPAKINIIGRKFTRALVLEDAPPHINPDGSKQTRSRCRCDCGNIFITWNKCLLNGKTMSCGCFHREQLGNSRRTHGMTRTRTYFAWRNMLNRCFYEKLKDFERWGGRGITVCERWRHSFENFYADVGEAPIGKTIERIDNARGYEPGNVSWETRKVQARNTRSNRVVTVQGFTGCLIEVCEHFNLPYKPIHHRLQRGWSIERTFTQPIRAW